MMTVILQEIDNTTRRIDVDAKLLESMNLRVGSALYTRVGQDKRGWIYRFDHVVVAP